MISRKLLKQYGVKNIAAYFDNMMDEYDLNNINVVMAMFSNANETQKKEYACRLVRARFKSDTICYFINLI